MISQDRGQANYDLQLQLRSQSISRIDDLTQLARSLRSRASALLVERIDRMRLTNARLLIDSRTCRALRPSLALQDDDP